MKLKTKTRETAEIAARKLREAEKLERKRPIDFSERALNPLYAQRAREEASRLLQPPEQMVGNRGTELVPAQTPDEHCSNARLYLLDTLENSELIPVVASEQRAEVATRAGVLSPALDAAACAQATTSIEKMLCHQMAALHDAGMELLARVEQTVHLPPAEHARMTNAAARLFEAYQTACLTLQKLKTKGEQYVVVTYQQVNVGPGGQAIVAARVKRGSRRRRGRTKNEGSTPCRPTRLAKARQPAGRSLHRRPLRRKDTTRHTV